VLKKIAIGLVVLVLGLVALILTRPSTYVVERSLTMAAPPETVFALVDDFHAWPKWSPWDDLDPAMSTSFSGPDAGTGAVYAWTGNDDVGTGKMTITSSAPPTTIEIDLEFIEPFASSSVTSFAFAPEGDGTKVTWTMSGDNDFMGKAFSLFMDMDTMIGADFEKGLAQLKTVAEAAPAQPEA
jgi:uncharacterized protein YndB with AHSA1/START domain